MTDCKIPLLKVRRLFPLIQALSPQSIQSLPLHQITPRDESKMHHTNNARSGVIPAPPRRYSSVERARNVDYPYTAYKPGRASHPYTANKPSHASHPYIAYRPHHTSYSYATYRPKPSDANYPYTAYRPHLGGPPDRPPKEVPQPLSSYACVWESENSVVV